MNVNPKIVVIGLSISSSWGNGHATTYRSLLKGLQRAGCEITFFERDLSWYRPHRDMPEPDFCRLIYYESPQELSGRFRMMISAADVVLIGSYVPDGITVIDEISRLRPKLFCFYDIDTPVTLSGLEKGDEEYIAVSQVPLFDIYFSFSGGPALLRLERDFGAARAEPLYCSVDQEAYHNTNEPYEFDLGYLGTYSPDRQPLVDELLIKPARLLPAMRFVVAGPQYPNEIDWPANVSRIDHLPPPLHPSFYSRQRYTLNVTRRDMVRMGWSPSVRLFEAGACAVPIISDAWDGLKDIIPEGVLLARTASDVVRALTSLDAADRDTLAWQIHQCVVQRHSADVRAETFLRAVYSEINSRVREQGLPSGNLQV
jgi:spore maturation protein CgeB